MNKKTQIFNGVKFTRDDETGYYLNSTIRKRMHVYVWEFYNGKVPKGFEVHHKDFDRSNNDISNLQLMTATEHKRYHGENQSAELLQFRRENLATKARPKANEWHGSEEGREWHKAHYAEMGDKLHERVTKTCKQCGKEFQGLSYNLFCSNACKSAYRRKTGVDNVERICKVCGKTFTTNRYTKVQTCSYHCRAVLISENRRSKENNKES